MKRSSWPALFQRSAALLQRAARSVRERQRPQPVQGQWRLGLVMTSDGPRRYHLFQPAGVRPAQRLPLLVMLHGCQQDAQTFAASTRMNLLAARERCLVLYPEQSRLANPLGCWNWFDTQTGRAFSEAAWIMAAIDQTCARHGADSQRVAVAGLSAGASMAALLGTRYPQRFKAVVMHSGVPPGMATSAASAVDAMRGRHPGEAPPQAPGDVKACWPPLLVIHGDADRIVSARNAEAAVLMWSQAGGAKAGATLTQQRGARHPMAVTHFKCRRRLVATKVQVHGLIHGWSGGAARQRFSDAQGPDASRMTWRFAKRQFETHCPTSPLSR